MNPHLVDDLLFWGVLFLMLYVFPRLMLSPEARAALKEQMKTNKSKTKTKKPEWLTAVDAVWDTLTEYDKNRRADISSVLDLTRDLQRKVALLEESTGGLWKTRSGVLIQVRDMTDAHLRNAREWLKGHGKPKSANLDQEHGRREAAKKVQEHLDAGRKPADPTVQVDPWWSKLDSSQRIYDLTSALQVMTKDRDALKRKLNTALARLDQIKGLA